MAHPTLLSESQAELILPKLSKYLPRSVMMYNVFRLKLEVYPLRDANNNPPIQIRIYSSQSKDSNSDEDFSEGYIALINIEELPQTIVVAFSFLETPSPIFLQNLLSLIDWNKPHQFEAIENNIAFHLAERCKKEGTLLDHDAIELFYMPDEVIKQLLNKFDNGDCDGGHSDSIQVETLQEVDAVKINKNWPAACPGSLEMLQTSIPFVGSGGVVFKSYQEEEDRSLISWAVALPFGSIHALHTEPKYQGRGYAKLTMQLVSKDVAKRGRIPSVQIYKKNDTSKKVNQSIGFVYSHDIQLLHYYPSEQ